MKVIFLILLFPSLTIFAQDSLVSHQSARFEVGLGPGLLGKDAGLSGRIALSYINSSWGGVIRVSANEGGGFMFPKKSLYDNAILGSYVIREGISSQVIASAGIGSAHGSQSNSSSLFSNKEDFGRVVGFAYEFGIASAGSTFGWALNILGNVNSKSNLIAVIISLTIGYQK